MHSDPGHAWLAVKLSEIKMLGIETEISSYSYVKGKTAYLEEEIDALRRNKDIIEACIMDRYCKVFFSYTAEPLEDKRNALDYKRINECYHKWDLS
jgi:hypothetical protein